MKKVIILITLSVIFIGGCNFIDRTFNKQKRLREAAERARLDSIAKAQTDSIRLAEESEQARVDSLKAAEANKQTKFHIIAGSFKMAENAQKYLKKMECEGYKPQIIQSNNGFNLVSIAAFDNFKGADKQVKKIRDEGKYRVWIYCSN
jgi:cell division protein FtsN